MCVAATAGLHHQASSQGQCHTAITVPLACPAETELLPPPYTAQVSLNNFFLNISLASHADAEAACSAGGGHLAAYMSIEEQVGEQLTAALYAQPLNRFAPHQFLLCSSACWQTRSTQQH